MPTAKITSKGQVTVPKRVRDALGLQTGDALHFVPHGDGFIVYKDVAGSRFDRWVGALGHLDGSDPDAIVDELRGER